MKIGIITFHNVVNYGGVLQSYALQQFLKKQGYSVDIIDYECKQFKKFYSPFYIEKLNLRKIAYMIYAFFPKSTRLKIFKEFRKKYLGLSERYTYKNIDQIDGKYDVLISGSDQVWNLQLTNGDKNYFLDFHSTAKKISYAASIGMKEIPEKLINEYSRMILAFDSISVREESAKELLEGIIDKDVSVCVDPVILVGNEGWIEMKERCSLCPSGEYILVYKINQSDCYDAAKKLSVETNLPVVVIKPDKLCAFGFIKYKFVAPDQFVSLFGNAKYVITDSFHGTVFSILFEKQFMYFPDKKTDNRNGRITNLLSLVDLDGRIATSLNDIDMIYDSIQYGQVNNILNVKRQNSKDYLLNALERNT